MVVEFRAKRGATRKSVFLDEIAASGWRMASGWWDDTPANTLRCAVVKIDGVSVFSQLATAMPGFTVKEAPYVT